MLRFAAVAVVAAIGLTAWFWGFHENSEEPPHRERPRGTRRNNPSEQERRQIRIRRKADFILNLWNETEICPICTDNIEQNQPISNCLSCYAIFHLSCIETHVSYTPPGFSWYCPCCRFPERGSPQNTCMCGKTLNPPNMIERCITPHCCELTCDECKELCHPGPCV